MPVTALLPLTLDGRDTRITDLHGPQIGGTIAAFPVLGVLARARRVDPATAEIAIAQSQIYASRTFLIVGMRVRGATTASIENGLEIAAASTPSQTHDRWMVMAGRRVIVIGTGAGVTYAHVAGDVVFLLRSAYLDLISGGLAALP